MAGNTLQLTPITAALKVKDATMKHNSGRGANTMEFPIASIGKFVGGGRAYYCMIILLNPLISSLVNSHKTPHMHDFERFNCWPRK